MESNVKEKFRVISVANEYTQLISLTLFFNIVVV